VRTDLPTVWDVLTPDRREHGCGVRLLISGILCLLAACSGPEAVRVSKASATPSVEEGARDLPPEGKLLLYTNDGPVILSHAEDTPMYLQRPG
jgi:hypothetical protein